MTRVFPERGSTLGPCFALSILLLEGPASDVVDRPDLPGERDDVGSGADELQRRRPGKPGGDDRESAVLVHPHERAGVWHRRRTRRIAAPGALREGEQRASAELN